MGPLIHRFTTLSPSKITHGDAGPGPKPFHIVDIAAARIGKFVLTVGAAERRRFFAFLACWTRYCAAVVTGSKPAGAPGILRPTMQSKRQRAGSPCPSRRSLLYGGDCAANALLFTSVFGRGCSRVFTDRLPPKSLRSMIAAFQPAGPPTHYEPSAFRALFGLFRLATGKKRPRCTHHCHATSLGLAIPCAWLCLPCQSRLPYSVSTRTKSHVLREPREGRWTPSPLILDRYENGVIGRSAAPHSTYRSTWHRCRKLRQVSISGQPGKLGGRDKTPHNVLTSLSPTRGRPVSAPHLIRAFSLTDSVGLEQIRAQSQLSGCYNRAGGQPSSRREVGSGGVQPSVHAFNSRACASKLRIVFELLCRALEDDEDLSSSLDQVNLIPSKSEVWPLISALIIRVVCCKKARAAVVRECESFTHQAPANGGSAGCCDWLQILRIRTSAIGKTVSRRPRLVS